MKLTFKPIQTDDSIRQITQHLTTLPSAIDSFFEGHILESSLYEIELAGAKAGFTAIYKENLVSQFFLEPAYRGYGQSVFAAIKRLENVQAALVPSCDEFFLSHAIDDYHHLKKQAYLFAIPSPFSHTIEPLYRLRQATNSDTEYITSAGIFGDESMVKNKILNHELFITLLAESTVGCGIIEKSRLLDGVASVGMFVSATQRQKGIGTATIKLLIAECQNQNLRPVAGCGYTNHLSKKTLERAGMFTQTRLLKVDF